MTVERYTKEPLPLIAINKIWERFFALYGSRFTDFWNGASPKQMVGIKKVWLEELSGYLPEEIEAGIYKCKDNDYPPTLPQFLKMCRPPINYEASFHEAVKQLHHRKEGLDKWSTPAIYYAAITMSHELQNCTYESVKGRWKNAIDTATEDIKSGKMPNTVPLAIMPPSEIKITPEKARENIEKLRKAAEGLFERFEK